MFSEIRLQKISFIFLVNILLSEEDCQALHKNPSETVVHDEWSPLGSPAAKTLGACPAPRVLALGLPYGLHSF